MNNQTLIILAILLLFFMGKNKENMNNCGWEGGGGPCDPSRPSNPCDECDGLECDPDSDHHEKCCGNKSQYGQPYWCYGPQW